MTNTPSPPRTQQLPQFVGYREVQTALGVSRRTVERMVLEGRFPCPVQLTPNRVGWQVDTVTGWLSERSKGLVSTAVSQPENLEPDQLEKHAVDLVVKSIEQRTGQKVDAADLGIHVTRGLTADEFRDAERREFALYSERFSEFDRRRACVMSAWLFASLRVVIENSVQGREKLIYGSRETLEHFGPAALNDEEWEDLITRFDALG